MKILFVSSSPINRSISIGNTFLNVFDGIEDVEFLSIYTRNGLPDIKIKHAFRITEKMILKGKNVGKEVFNRYNGENTNDVSAIKFVKKKRWTIFFWLQSLIWKLPFWKSKGLKNFLETNKPDIIFTVLSDLTPLNTLIIYVCKYTKKPLFLYAWDDNYSLKTSGKSPLKKLTRFSNRFQMRKLVKRAEKIYVISKIQKMDYEKWFGKECIILTKSADFSLNPAFKEKYNKPLQFVFTGNIGMNRWKSLGLIAKALTKINQNEIQAQLRIYSATPLTEEMSSVLNIEGTSFFMGTVSAKEVKDLQKDADILVHVEGLDKKSRIATRQSFSTKLVDYFEMARPILAVGPREISSIEHLLENNCAIVASNEDQLYVELQKVLSDTSVLQRYAENAYLCGKKCHDTSIMKKMLKEDVFEVYKGE